ncbi:MAG: EamA family transporter [Gemmatimonadaceae bacterium]|nr:EamA family transporter [Acetobacteraceae bacterium]
MFAAMCLIWGSTWIAAKAGLMVVPPSLYAGTRFVVAGGAILLFVGWRRHAMRVAPGHRARMAAVALLMVSATYSLLFWGASVLSTGMAAILDMAFIPMALLGIGALFGEDRITAGRACGIGVGVGGLVMLFGPRAFTGDGTSTIELLAAGATVLSAILYSLGSVLARPLLRVYSPLLIAGVTNLGGGIVMVAGSVAFEPGAVAALSGRWGLAAWAGWWFLVVFGSLAAFTIFLHLVREWGGARAGAYAFVSPVIAVMLGIAVYGETVTPMEAAGMATMLAGAWLTVRPA